MPPISLIKLWDYDKSLDATYSTNTVSFPAVIVFVPFVRIISSSVVVCTKVAEPEVDCSPPAGA